MQAYRMHKTACTSVGIEFNKGANLRMQAEETVQQHIHVVCLVFLC